MASFKLTATLAVWRQSQRCCCSRHVQERCKLWLALSTPPPSSFILNYPASFHFTCSLFLTTSSLNCTFLIINPFHFSNIDNNSCILFPLFLFLFLSRCLSRTRALSPSSSPAFFFLLLKNPPGKGTCSLRCHQAGQRVVL